MRWSIAMTEITKGTPKEVVLRIAAEDLNHGKECSNCNSHCCRFTGGMFTSEEINHAAKNLGMSRKEFIDKCMEETERFNTKTFIAKQRKRKGKPYGSCIFLKENRCSIHDFKPLHCRAGSCMEHGEKISIWYALNHHVNPADPESIRQWASYLKSHPAIKGGRLKELVKDNKKLRKMLNYEAIR